MIIVCRNPVCGQRLKLPDDRRGILRVRCPRCKTMFDWSQPGLQFEIREVALRCAVTGLKSSAVFIRDQPTELFRFRLVDAGNASIVRRGEAWKAAERRRAEAEAQRKALAFKGGGRWLAVVAAGGKQIASWAGVVRAQFTANEETTVGMRAAGDAHAPFNAADFDWSGIWCPHCKSQSALAVIHCGKCREVMCTGGVVELVSGVKTFRCHDGCGHSGEVGLPANFGVDGNAVALDRDERDRLLRKPKAIEAERRPAIGSVVRKALPAPSQPGQGRHQ